MTAPRILLPPPADYWNRPPKETAGYQNISQPNGPVEGGNGAPGMGVGALTFHSFSGFPLELRAQPPGVTNYFTNWLWYPASGHTHARIVTHNYKAGAATARLIARFSATPTNGASFANAGRSGTEIFASITPTGPIKGDWFALDPAARTDIGFQIMAIGGDGVASPALGDVELEFDVRIELPRQKLFWRNLVPSAQPPANVETDSTLAAYTGFDYGDSNVRRSFAVCVPPLDTREYTTPTIATVQANAKLLSFAKATSNLGAGDFTGSGPDAHEDLGSWYARLVSPPLAPQRIDGFTYEHWFSAVSGSAFTDGSVMNHFWLWRPGVGRLAIGTSQFAQSFAGGFGQKYVRYIRRQCRNWGFFPGFDALGNDRFILDLAGVSICDCGFLSHNQGLGTWAGYNGTVEPSDPEGFADGFPGTASFTDIPRFKYLAAA